MNCDQPFDTTCELSQTERANCKFLAHRAGICLFYTLPQEPEVAEPFLDPADEVIELIVPVKTKKSKKKEEEFTPVMSEE
jgi:hypothetical protein